MALITLVRVCVRVLSTHTVKHGDSHHDEVPSFLVSLRAAALGRRRHRAGGSRARGTHTAARGYIDRWGGAEAVQLVGASGTPARRGRRRADAPMTPLEIGA
jgi:hypothetical protein